ncbi:MAG: hypothetical protein HY038_13775 [Nitrospirae bacterium]|nr:hypothetical protein [Nitrospirota bacterium]
MSKNFSRDASRVTLMERSLSSYSLRAILTSCMALAILSGPSQTWATDSNINASGHRLIDHQRIQDMKERVAELRERMKHHQHNSGGTTTGSTESLQAKVTSLENSMTSLLSTNSTLLTSLQAAQAQLTTLQARIAVLESRPTGGGGVPGLENYVSIDLNQRNGVNGPHIIFKGVNVHVQSGSNKTVDTTGLGNLIIGYNELRTDGVGLNRAGSHNLVGGEMNAFSSSGGLVFGSQNWIREKYAAILGGEQNIASGSNSSVLGGGQNTASGPSSTVYGGQGNSSTTTYSFAPIQGSPVCLGC